MDEDMRRDDTTAVGPGVPPGTAGRVLVALVLLAACTAEPFPAPPPYPVVVERNVPARMRDGVVLRADIYRPDTTGRFPALLQRTPYSKGAQGIAERSGRRAGRGYVVVVQDTRGRYTSDGAAVPHDEAEDGHDAVEWVASLPYVNGQVGMFGGSYLATTQLMAASQAPPSLVAIQPSASYASRYDMVYQGGAFYLSDGLGWNLGQAADVRRREAGAPFAERDGPIGMTDEERRLFREAWLWHVPTADVPAPDLARFAPGYFRMLEHPSYDAFWETYDIAARHGAFEVPALHVTGWFDTLLPGTLANFAGLRANAATERARQGQRLIVGPWTHASPTRESTRIGDVDFGARAGLDLAALRDSWFDHWLLTKGPDLGGPPVRLFVMGENRWAEADAWPPPGTVPTRFHLLSGGSANSLAGDGGLSLDRPRREPPDRYTYDPADPVPTGGLGGYSRAPYDPSAIQDRDDILVYTSDPLERPLEVLGQVKLVLWVASSAPDTDFTGSLIDVLPDGSARTLGDGILRARYRNGKTAPALLTPGEPVRVEIDLLATANVFLPGHRIRVAVSSSNFPRFDRNPNTGAPIATEGELRAAQQTIFHDADRPSYLLLPVLPR